MTDTIYALATSPGRAGVAVIRISGPEAFQTLNILCKKFKINHRKSNKIKKRSWTSLRSFEVSLKMYRKNK